MSSRSCTARRSFDRQLRAVAERVDGPLHRCDVVEDLQGGHVGVSTGVAPGDVCLEEATCADLQAFDARRRNGLCSQEQTCDCLGVREGCHLAVEAGNRLLGVADVGGCGPREDEVSRGEPVGLIGFVVAALTVAPRQS